LDATQKIKENVLSVKFHVEHLGVLIQRNNMINLLITFYSMVNGIDTSLAFQMARVESNMNPNAVSRTEDGGLYQLNRNSHRFHNEKWRFQPVTNMAIAMNYLAKLKEKCTHKSYNSYIICYNVGTQGARKIKFPFKQSYYRKMNILWRH
jgi:soluble lytic murein transglycosylase-like protein